MIELFYITNNPYEARIVDELGIDWIFIDLERIGKEERQKKRDTVKSDHLISDISKIRSVIKKSKILVRCNPFGHWTSKEIYKIAENNHVDMVMLPYFKKVNEVREFILICKKYSLKVALLLETLDGINNLEEILKLDGIDYVHIGLNDIHIERDTAFMFEPFTDGLIKKIVKNLNNYKQKFGIGGLACLSKNILPSAKTILNEHYNLGSEGVILSRSFKPQFEMNRHDEFRIRLKKSLDTLRDYESIICKEDKRFFDQSYLQFCDDIELIRSKIRKR